MWGPVQYDVCSYTKKLGHRYAEGRPGEELGEGGTYKPRKREALEGTTPADTWVLDSQPLPWC